MVRRRAGDRSGVRRVRQVFLAGARNRPSSIDPVLDRLERAPIGLQRGARGETNNQVHFRREADVVAGAAERWFHGETAGGAVMKQLNATGMSSSVAP
jgi:hypothetical protein